MIDSLALLAIDWATDTKSVSAECHIKVTFQSHCHATEILLFCCIPTSECNHLSTNSKACQNAHEYIRKYRQTISLSALLLFHIVPLELKKQLPLLQGRSNRYTNQLPLKAALPAWAQLIFNHQQS